VPSSVPAGGDEKYLAAKFAKLPEPQRQTILALLKAIPSLQYELDEKQAAIIRLDYSTTEP
jgi:hypothetical protein